MPKAKHRTAAIHIEGAYGSLQHAGLHHLEACLAIDDPSRFFNRAYKEGRWDGKQRLYHGRKFPAGLAAHVEHYLAEQGIPVRQVGQHDDTVTDLDRFDATYLGPVGRDGGDLWDHQVEAVRTLLQHERGILRSATGSGKTEIIAAGARYLWEEHGWRSLIVVPDKDILDQTVRRLEGYYDGCPEVGQYGDGVKRPGDIIVGTAATLIGFQARKRKKRGKNTYEQIPPNQELRRIVQDFEVIWFDEAHHTSSEQWMEIALASGAKRRYGLSGTPLRGDEIQDLRLIGATGPIVKDIPAKVMIDLGLAAKPCIVMVDTDATAGDPLPKVWRFGAERDLPYKDAYQQGVVENVQHNRAVVRAAEWLTDRGKRTLILCRRKDHWLYLKGTLEKTGIDFHALWGDTPTDVRNEAKRQLTNAQTQCILATTIWDEGTDVPAIDAIVLAEGVKTPVNTLQRVGRGMRAKKDGPNEVWIVDFVPGCHPKLVEHALIRCETYEAEGYEVVALHEWDTEQPDTLLPFERWDAVYGA